MLFLIPIILCSFIAFYFYVRKCNNYWNERGVPTVKTNTFLGITYNFLIQRQPLEKVHENIYWARPEERYVGFYNMLKPILFVRDPDLLHQILVKDFSYFHTRAEVPAGVGRLNDHLFVLEGEQWKNVRNKLVPPFSTNKLKKMYDMINECAEMVVELHLRPLAKTGNPVDVKEKTERFSLDVIGKCAFGLQFNSLKESDSLYREIGKTFTDAGFINTVRFAFILACPSLLKLVGLRTSPKKVEDFFFDLLHGAEDLRRKEAPHRDDMLQLMLDLKHQDKLTENHIVSNMFAFYSAGHEPTSHAITFALYELALNQEIQEKLRVEIEKAREANGGVLDYAAIVNIAYLEMVVAETLRLHSTAPLNTRVCTKAYKIPGSSLEVKPGQHISYLASAFHKDEKYFPNPLKFDPERFSEKNIANVNPHTYLSWGGGPRACIGARFAKLEIKICLVAILSQFKLSLCNKTEVPIILKKSFFHAPKNGVWLTVEEIQRKNV